jgi:hypothetical protein
VRLDLDRHQSEILLKAVVLVAIVAASFQLTACSNGTSSGSPASPSVSCPTGDPLLGIYEPKRLTVEKPCQWFHGVVKEVEPRSDGDTHILLAPDDGYTKFLNVENVNTGGMIVEIVPGQSLPAPAVGAHVAVFGTWVLDEHNNWNEIHPVWAISDLTTGGTDQGMPPASPRYRGDGND